MATASNLRKTARVLVSTHERARELLDSPYGIGNDGWYLVGLCSTRSCSCSFHRRGIWGRIGDRFNIRLLSVV